MRMPALLFAFTFILSCGDSSDTSTTDRTDGYTPVLKNKEDSLFHDVMQGHDVGMAKMGKLSGALKTVQKQLDSIESLSGRERGQLTDYKALLNSLKEELQQAETGMMLWMEEFVADSLQDNPEQRAEYLASEKAKVEKVRDDILGSLAKADSVFKGVGKLTN